MQTVRLIPVVLASAVLSGVQPQGEIAIRDVTVLAGTDAPPAVHTTVLVRGDRIAALGPAAEISIPPGARIVEGAGRYLVPGLIDLHVHLSKSRASSLGLFLANGVTTVRDMGGDHEELLTWRREIAAGTRRGPRILMAGPYLEAAANVERMRRDPPDARVEPFERTRIPVGSPDDARRIVASLAAREVDFLKIRTVQDRDTYLALNEAADAHGIPLVGHVAGIPPDVVLEAGQDGVDHPFYPSLDIRSPEARAAFWTRFARTRVPVVPTLVTLFESAFVAAERLKAVTDDETETVDPRRAFVARYSVLDWREQVLEHAPERQALLRKIWDEGIRRDLREMHEAGVDVLAGSDAAVVNIFPGFSLHDELALLVREVGMSPAQAIERATSRSARFLRRGDSIGSVERGKVADLVLLEANPLEDIRHTRRIAAVLVRGEYFDRQALDRLLDEVRAHPDRQTDDWGRTRPR